MWKSSRVSKWGGGFFRGVFPTFWHIWFLSETVSGRNGDWTSLPSVCHPHVHQLLWVSSAFWPAPPCSPQTPSSRPPVLRQRSPGPALRKPAGSVRHLLSRTGEPAGSTWGGSVGQHFLSLRPTPRPRGRLPLPRVFPVSQARSIQDTHCQGSECHIPVASHPTGRAGIPAWGVGVGQGCQRRELRPWPWGQGQGLGRATGVPQLPPEWARKSPSASLGLEEAGVAETVNCSQRT